MAFTSSDYLYYWIKRLHAPIGMLLSLSFIVLYIIPLSSITDGPQAFDGFMGFVSSLPAYDLLQISGVWIPTAIYAALSILAMYTSSINLVSYGSYGNWMYVVRQFEAMIVVPFVTYHIFIVQMSHRAASGYMDYYYMRGILASTAMKVFYMAGIVSLMFCLITSAVALTFEWGVATSRGSKTAIAAVMWCVGIALAVWAGRIIFLFY